MVFDRADAAALGRARLLRGLRIAEVGDDLWLRGDVNKGDAAAMCARLPARERYRVIGEQFFPTSGELPLGTLPAAEWMPLRSWLSVGLGSGAGGTRHLPQTVSPQLVRGGAERACGAVTVSLRTLAEWVELTAVRRMTPLRYVVSGDGNALVVGAPSPPLAGDRYWLDDGLLMPLGWHWQPDLPASTWRELLDLGAGDLALFAADGGWTLVQGEALMPLTRASLRLTIEGSPTL
jgi:hypothetical protein